MSISVYNYHNMGFMGLKPHAPPGPSLDVTTLTANRRCRWCWPAPPGWCRSLGIGVGLFQILGPDLGRFQRRRHKTTIDNIRRSWVSTCSTMILYYFIFQPESPSKKGLPVEIVLHFDWRH